MAEDTKAGDMPRDEKDWTWTIERVCPDCGFEAGVIPGPQIATWVKRLTDPWPDLLIADDVRTRPDPSTWSPLEYAAHVRDMCRTFADRVALMLAEDSPEFANWDQDQAAIDGDYAAADPAVVSEELMAAAEQLSSAFAEVPPDGWDRPGQRSNGASFTVLTLGQYCLHDLAHHLMDVGEGVPGTPV